MTQPEQVQAMVARTVQDIGPLTVMVANAGITKVKGVLELTAEDVRETMDVNFMGVFNCYQAAAKLASFAITVNAYAPGIVATPMWKGLREGLEERNAMSKETTLEEYAASNNAMKRLGKPEDIANVIGGFLVRPDASYVTGQTIVVDGGIIFT